MRVINKYENLAKALCDAEQIEKESNKEDVEQYEWTILCIRRICNQILDENPKNLSESERNNRVEIEKILDKYERIWYKL